jgi:hypothetical protein
MDWIINDADKSELTDEEIAAANKEVFKNSPIGRFARKALDVLMKIGEDNANSQRFAN